MNWMTRPETRCAICRRSVDNATRERARWALEPLIVCDTCVREADRRWAVARLAARAAV
jgi:hypothetical protein